MGEKLKALWAQYKWTILPVIIGFVIAAARNVIIAFLVRDSKKDVTKAQKQDQQLAQQQTQAQVQATQFVQQAEQLDSDKPEVTEDWYKK